MFEALQGGLTSAFKTLRSQGKLSESNMRDGLKLVEKSLLEADVGFAVTREFMGRVTDSRVTPAQVHCGRGFPLGDFQVGYRAGATIGQEFSA